MFEKEFGLYKKSKSVVPEEVMEKALIHYLVNELGYIYREDIKEYSQLEQNFRNHFEKLNDYKFTDDEFNKWWIEFNKGDVFHRFLTLKSGQKQTKDKKTKIGRVLDFFDFKNPKNNSFEVINQLWVDNKNEGRNRFDLLLLINGIPTIHIELKREDVNNYCGLKQIENYKDINAVSNFLLFTKLFVHSNGSNTRYFANNDFHPNRKGKSFRWSDENNNPINEMLDFASHMFNKDFIIGFIENYFIVDKGKNEIKVFRPYQYYACKKIINNINNPQLNCRQKSGYVWHATGSGKTLTCFKTCEILSEKCPNVDLTIFLIDRNDLNHQTVDNFNNFTTNPDLVSNAVSTNDLIGLLTDNKSNKKIIVTTIQKLNHAIKETRKERLKDVANKSIVFMVDEGHRSQIGEMRKNIEKFFTNAINIAFTGTPIFDKNAVDDGLTTQNIFGDEIHRYRSLEAMKDGNVLDLFFNFANTLEGIKEETITEYEQDLIEAKNNLLHVEINEKRIIEIVNYINNYYDTFTYNKKFNAMLACSSIPEAIEYYKTFKKTTNLIVGIIYTASLADYSSNNEISKEAAEFMLERIKENNATWNFKSFDRFKTKIQDDFSKERKYDILIVVSMLLTGFDSPITNTIFLDKKLKDQAFIQAVSRTNRLYEGKKVGNVICFKTDKDTAKAAFDLYTNGGINTPIPEELKWKVKEYTDIKLNFEKIIKELRIEYPNFNEIFNISETDDNACYNFVKLFSKLINVYNEIRAFADFKWDDFDLNEREYHQLKGKYATIIDNNKSKKIIYIHDYFQISDFDTLEVNAEFLRTLVTRINHFNLKDDQNNINIEELDAYKELCEFVKTAKSEKDRDLLQGFIKLKEFYKKDITYDDIVKLWKEYIESIIKKITKKSLFNWKTTSMIIEKLMEELKIKKRLDHEFIEENLKNYIDDPLDSAKYQEVENTIRELITLKDKLNDVLINNNMNI